MADSICQNEHLEFTKSNDFEASCTPKAWLNRNEKKTSNPSPPVVQRISKVEGWFPSHFLSNTDLSRPTPLTAVVHTDSFDMTKILLLSNSETKHAFVHH